MVTQHNGELYQTATLAVEEVIEENAPDYHAPAKDDSQAVQSDINLAQFRSIFEHVSDGLVVIDLDSGMLLTANPAYCQMHGYSCDEILTLNPLDLIPATFHPKYLSFLETVRDGKQFTCEANCRRPDGTPFYIEIKSVPFLYDEKICALSVIRDVTERVQLQQSIEEQNVQLEKALADLKQAQVSIVQSAKMSSLGQLVAGVAHELNNPVSFIQGNLNYVNNYAQDLLTLVEHYQVQYPNPNEDLQAILDDLDLPFLQEDLNKILSSMRTGSERIADIVRSLRGFSRMDEADLKSVDIHEGIDHSLMLLQHRFAEGGQHQGIGITRNYKDLPMVSCYPGLLNQVFMNILTNAVDAIEYRYEEGEENTTPERPSHHITIETDLVDDQVQIAIANTGPSIPPHHQARIFDPFFTTKPVGQGIGMNMSISYQTVTKRHGGTLQCISNSQTGTQFIIQLPREQSAL